MFFNKNTILRILVIASLGVLIPCQSTAQNDTAAVVSDTAILYNTDSIAKQIVDVADTLSNDTVDENKYTVIAPIIFPDSAETAADSMIVLYFKGSVENLKLNDLTHIDTNTYHFQRYDPLHINNGMYSTLSNIGLAAKNLVYTPTLSTSYYLGSSVFTNYLYHNEGVKYYNPLVPYTELNYVMGGNRQQNFNVIFTRKIFRGFTFGLDYALNFSPSDDSPYLRSGINEQRVFFTTQYYTKDKRYGIITNYLANKIVAKENGGIINDSLFENNIETDRRLIPVNLMKAENFVKQSGFFIEQYFNILSPQGENDTIKRKIDPGNISYSFRYRRNQMIYTDSDSASSFYLGRDITLDTISTYDSLYQEEFKNTIRWSNIGYHENPKAKIFYMFMGASHSYIKQMLPHDSVSTTYSQLTTF